MPPQEIEGPKIRDMGGLIIPCHLIVSNIVLIFTPKIAEDVQFDNIYFSDGLVETTNLRTYDSWSAGISS